MDFLRGMTNLTNWLGNVIMPTMAGLFFAIGILRYAKGQVHGYVPYAGVGCLVVSGILRALETFTGPTVGAWNDPDLLWLSLRTLVNWVCNVFMPVYAVLQIVQGVLAYGGVGSRLYAGFPWMRHFASAALALMLSGLLRMAEFFVAQGLGGIS
jgi:hypothetical protein